MGKSLEFIKERIKSGGTNGMEKYDWMEEQTPFEVLKESLKLAITGSILCNQTFKYNILNKGTFKVKLIYNPNAEYDYFTIQRCSSDSIHKECYGLFFKRIVYVVLWWKWIEKGDVE